MDSEYDYLFKVLIIGDSSVGKTSVLLRYVDDIFHSEFQTTIGVDFKVTTLQVDSANVKLQLWDTAGQDRYRNIVSSYYRGAHGLVIMYDVTNSESFEHVRRWYEESQNFLASDIPRLLIGNKVDLDSQRVISKDDANTLAEGFNMQYVETSAKNNLNLKEAFERLTRQVLKSNVSAVGKTQEKDRLGETKAIKKSSCC